MALGDPYITVGTGATTNVSAEAVLAVTPISSNASEGGQGNYVSGVVNIPNVAATGTVTVRVRQTALVGGTLLATFGPYTVGTAQVGMDVPFAVLDSGSAVTGISQYNVTLQIGVVANSGAGVTSVIGVTPAGVSN
jgi:hypothetical protein